ncbi:MAG: class I SAM-dependent methyltransferase [Bacteroidota bacterium]
MQFPKQKDDYGACDVTYAEARRKGGVLAFRYKFRASVAAELIKKYGIERPRVIDFGCADGLTLQEMKKQIADGSFSGVEITDELVASAQAKGFSVSQGDITDLSSLFGNESHDVITALAVLEHLPEPEAAGKEAFRILKPGGLLIVTCPDPKWELIAKTVKLFKDTAHYTNFNKLRFREFGSACGFSLDSYTRFMFDPVAFLPYLKIPVNVSFAKHFESVLCSLKIFDWCFVNQVAVFQKPLL